MCQNGSPAAEKSYDKNRHGERTNWHMDFAELGQEALFSNRTVTCTCAAFSCWCQTQGGRERVDFLCQIVPNGAKSRFWGGRGVVTRRLGSEALRRRVCSPTVPRSRGSGGAYRGIGRLSSGQERGSERMTEECENRQKGAWKRPTPGVDPLGVAVNWWVRPIRCRSQGSTDGTLLELVGKSL
jgi:hypothetical protein